MPEPEITEETGKLVEFPEDEIQVRMPTQRLPEDLGRIEDGHPLQKPLMIALWVFGLFLIIYILATIFGSVLNPGQSGENISNDRPTFSRMYREEGSITYDNAIMHGWFLDSEREHFMSQDGRRYTYVNSHEREGSQVTGYWRKIE